MTLSHHQFHDPNIGQLRINTTEPGNDVFSLQPSEIVLVRTAPTWFDHLFLLTRPLPRFLWPIDVTSSRRSCSCCPADCPTQMRAMKIAQFCQGRGFAWQKPGPSLAAHRSTSAKHEAQTVPFPGRGWSVCRFPPLARAKGAGAVFLRCITSYYFIRSLHVMKVYPLFL